MLSSTASHTTAGLTPKSRDDYKIVAKVTNNIFVLADSEGFLMGKYHVKDLRLRVEWQYEDDLGHNSDIQSEKQDLYSTPEAWNQTNL